MEITHIGRVYTAECAECEWRNQETVAAKAGDGAAEALSQRVDAHVASSGHPVMLSVGTIDIAHPEHSEINSADLTSAFLNVHMP